MAQTIDRQGNKGCNKIFVTNNVKNGFLSEPCILQKKVLFL